MRDTFLRMHQLMISADMLKGRYILFEKITDKESVERLTDDEYRDINRALATYNALGLYVAKKYLREHDVMDLWAGPIHRAWHTAQPFIAHRAEYQGHDPWAYFELLAQKAERNLTQRGINTHVKVWSRAIESTSPQSDEIDQADSS